MAFLRTVRAAVRGLLGGADDPRADTGGTDRRERRVERAVAGVLVASAAALALTLDDVPVSLPALAWFAALAVVLLQIEFEVGEGRTRPVQLVLVPMLLVLPAPLVPALMVLATVLARLPDAYRSRSWFIAPSIADAWFAMGPALVLCATGVPDGVAGKAAVLVAAVAAQILADSSAAAIRLRLGLGLPLRDQVISFAWVYFVDILLTPIGLLAAIVASDTLWAVAAVLPLAALLTIFARERAGRIENARALHRMAEENEARLESIVQNSSDLITIVGADSTIRTVTGATDTVFGPNRHAAIGSSIFDWAHADDASLLAALLARVGAADPRSSHESEWRIRREDGTYGYVETVATNLLDDERVRGIVLTARDIDERRAFEEQLRHRAFHDPLTQLANRALFYDRIEHAVAQQARDEQNVAVLFVDLDDFKAINDEMGHGVGDELLVGVAGRLRSGVRSADTVARLGGDEFGILLERVSGSNEVVQAAERILSAFNEPFVVHGDRIQLNLSIGVTVSGEGDADVGVDELLRRADLAMYAAKRAGKRRWDLYDRDLERLAVPAPATEPDRMTWFQRGTEQREEILNLLQRDDAIRMAFQPILDLRTGSVTGYEALARFVGPENRPPNAWFAQAHRFGLGYVLEARAAAAALGAADRPAGAHLTINLSPSALTSSEVQDVLPPQLDGVVIELTENELIGEAPGLEAAIADVRRRGGRIAIDDAGAGYAGLKHVMRLDPDLIKLDRSLVAGVEHDASRASLIASFVGYARDSGASVCAEGIETIGDLVRLADLDVTFGQGYVIARPAHDWPAASREATDACTVSFMAALALPSADDLEQVVALLAGARDRDDLAAAAAPIARELRADRVELETAPADLTEEVVQLLAGDGGAGPEIDRLTRSGYRSLLRVPVSCEGVVVATLEAYRESELPWSRFEIRRARMIAYQVGATITRLAPRRAYQS
jgi:diguanylate cyclase (GGDEF)-like protein/PAS domain S-box-containing protein